MIETVKHHREKYKYQVFTYNMQDTVVNVRPSPKVFLYYSNLDFVYGRITIGSR